MQLAELAKDLIFYLRAGAVCVSKRSCRAKREIMHPSMHYRSHQIQLCNLFFSIPVAIAQPETIY